MVIDLNSLAIKMVKCGITKDKLLKEDLDGWTDTIVDLLEEHYKFETALYNTIITMTDNK